MGAALLLAAEFTTVYEVVTGTLQSPRRAVSGGDKHSYTRVLVAGLVLVVMAFGAMRGSDAAAVALGTAAPVVSLAIELPDSRASGRLPEAISFEEAKAKRGAGLYLELAGEGLLVLGGAAALVPPGGESRAGTRHVVRFSHEAQRVLPRAGHCQPSIKEGLERNGTLGLAREELRLARRVSGAARTTSGTRCA